MAEESADTASDISHSIPSTTLAHLTWIFDLVEIRQHAFLVTGMMNRNWRVDTPHRDLRSQTDHRCTRPQGPPELAT